MKLKILSGSFGALLVLSVAFAVILVGAAAVVGSARVAHGPRMVKIQEAIYAQYGDLAHLTHFAPVVARVKYVKVVGSYHLPLDAPVAGSGPVATPVPGSTQAWKAQQPPVSAPAPSGSQEPDEGPLKTDVLATVVDSIKGTGVKTGDQLVITLDGGRDATGGPAEGDPLPAAGQEEVVFLWHNSRDSTKYATGGPDVRFAVAGAATVKAVVPGPVAKAHDGEAVGVFIAAVRAALAAPIH